MKTLWSFILGLNAICTIVYTANAVRMKPDASRILDNDYNPQKLKQNSDYIRQLSPNNIQDESVTDFVTGLPGLPSNSKIVHHAGRITVDDNDANSLFYWHFVASKSPESKPLLIWLNGGPGCSSMQGVFTGISPFKLQNSSSIKINHNSWHHYVNLLFLDQPIGTGMSREQGNNIRTDEDAISRDFYTFLTKFITLHDEYLVPTNDTQKQMTSRPLYLFGESHAGRYIPLFTSYILTQNQNIGSSDIYLDIKGVGIGNGWVHPYVQYDYSTFAHGIGLLSLGQVRKLQSQYVECEKALESENYNSPACSRNLDEILDGAKNIQAESTRKLNVYDVREYVESSSRYPKEMSIVTEYLDRLEVRQALHANAEPHFKFHTCQDDVFSSLVAFDGESTLSNLNKILEEGVQVLFYNGQYDMMCHHLGTEKLLYLLEWSGAESYQRAKKYVYQVHKHPDPSGFVTSGGNLTYLVVANAGHVVPYSVPDVAADMVRRFINNELFDDKIQPIARVKTNGTDLAVGNMMVCNPYGDNDESMDFIDANSFVQNRIALVLMIVVVLAILVLCVGILCLRTKHAGRPRHEMIVQVDDLEDDDLEDIDELEIEDMDDEVRHFAKNDSAHMEYGV